MTQKLKHILGLVGAIALPLLTVWGDAGTDKAVKIAVTISLVIPLIWSDPFKQAKVRTAILAAVPVATVMVSMLAARMSSAAAGGAMLTVVLAALTQLPRILAPSAIPFPTPSAPLPSSETTPVTRPETPTAKKGT
jgi:hypothetical protein